MNPEDPIKQLSQLTHRQREVLQLVCDGLRYKTVSEKLYVEVSTVKAHMGHIYIKLGLDQLPSAQRRKMLFQVYCPLLRGVELPPAPSEPPEKADRPEPVPRSIIKMIEDDEKAIVPWGAPGEAAQPVTVIEPQPVRVVEVPARPRGLRWMLVGMVLGVLLMVGIGYVFWGLPWAAESPQVAQTLVVEQREVIREVTVEVTSAPAPPQPTPTAIEQTREEVVTREVVEVAVVVTATPEDTPTSPPPTPIPAPTDTPVPPTPTPLPTPTVPRNTPPGSILEVGESWQQSGVRLKLKETNLSANCMSVRFDFYNDTDHQIVVVMDLEEMSAEDNLGQPWPPVSISDWTICDTRRIYTDPEKRTVNPNDNFGAHWIGFEGPVTDNRVTEVIVTVARISQISNARWRIPIYH